MKHIRQRLTAMRFISSAIFAALLATFAIGGAIGFASHRQSQSLIPAVSAGNGGNEMAALTTSFAPVVRKAQPVVVSIASTKVVKTGGDEGLSPLFDDPMFRQFFGDGPQNRFGKPREQREKGLGSGVIVSPDGHILTNNHVIEGASEIKVYTSDKRELKAHVVGADPKTDIAVIKVEAKNLPTPAFADSLQVQVGDIALAIGNPFGVGQTVTMGIVSATGRGNLVERFKNFPP